MFGKLGADSAAALLSVTRRAVLCVDLLTLGQHRIAGHGNRGTT